MDSDARAAPPQGLRTAGNALWQAITGDLGESLELDARELVILDSACRQADLVAALERAVARDGVTCRGSAGQRRLNAAVTELRQGRIALARLLGELELPDAGAGELATAASRRAQRAADTRWAAHAARRAK